MPAPAVDADALAELRRLYARQRQLSHALQAAYHSDVIDGHPGYSDADVAEIEAHVAAEEHELDPLCAALERTLLAPWLRWMRLLPGARFVADPQIGLVDVTFGDMIGQFPKDLVFALTGSDRPVELHLTEAGVQVAPRWRTASGRYRARI